jgi:hypothetical protein
MDSLSLNMADVNHESHKKILNAGQTREEREQNLVDSIPLFVNEGHQKNPQCRPPNDPMDATSGTVAIRPARYRNL